MLDTFYYTDTVDFEGSSFAAAAFHNADTDELVIVQHDGTNLFYRGVDFAIVGDFFKAESPGGYFHKEIRGRFNYDPTRSFTFFEPVLEEDKGIDDHDYALSGVTVSNGSLTFPGAVSGLYETPDTVTSAEGNVPQRVYVVSAYYHTFEDAVKAMQALNDPSMPEGEHLSMSTFTPED